MGDNKYLVIGAIATTALGISLLNHFAPKEKLIREIHYTRGVDTVRVTDTIVKTDDLTDFDLASKQMAFWRRDLTLDSSKSLIFERNNYHVYATVPRKDADSLAELIAEGLRFKGNSVTVRKKRSDPDTADIVLSTKYGLRHVSENGIKRSKKYPFIADSLKAHNLNPDFKWLPILESRYDIKSVSPEGAKGLWQFIEETGRRYGLKINRKVDERLDPEKSTSAFCKYMTFLIDKLGSEALAVTAYNHGENGIRKKLNKTNGKTLADIKPLMRFASKNFYASFRSVVDIAENHKQYGLNVGKTMFLPAPVKVPKKKEPVKEEKKSAPKEKKKKPVPRAEIISAKETKKPEIDTSKNFYVVRSGNNLSYIGDQFNIKWTALKEFNKMKSTAIDRGDTIWIPK